MASPDSGNPISRRGAYAAPIPRDELLEWRRGRGMTPLHSLPPGLHAPGPSPSWRAYSLVWRRDAVRLAPASRVPSECVAPGLALSLHGCPCMIRYSNPSGASSHFRLGGRELKGLALPHAQGSGGMPSCRSGELHAGFLIGTSRSGWRGLAQPRDVAELREQREHGVRADTAEIAKDADRLAVDLALFDLGDAQPGPVQALVRELHRLQVVLADCPRRGVLGAMPRSQRKRRWSKPCRPGSRGGSAPASSRGGATRLRSICRSARARHDRARIVHGLPIRRRRVDLGQQVGAQQSRQRVPVVRS
jgi:hypothetical protein